MDRKTVPIMDAVVEAREAKCISVRDLSKAVGIATPTYYNYLYGKTKMNRDVIDAFQHVLGIDLSSYLSTSSFNSSHRFIVPQINIVENDEIIARLANI